MNLTLPPFHFNRRPRLCSESGILIKYDKVEHFAREYLLNWCLGLINVPQNYRITIFISTAILYEIYDGFKDIRKTRDGADYLDALASMAGGFTLELAIYLSHIL